MQRSGDRVRITAQLIDALTGNHLWSQRYDRDLKDIFVLQDEIIVSILANLEVKLTSGGDTSRAENFSGKYYRGQKGLDCYLKSREATDCIRRWNIEDTNLARRLVEETITMCPENPVGYMQLGWVYQHDYWLGNTKSPEETLKKGIELAQKALAMDDSIAVAHGLLCAIYAIQRDYGKAIAEGERAVALNPGLAEGYLDYAVALLQMGRPEEDIPLLQKAIRLNPFQTTIYVLYGEALRNTGRYEEAVSPFKKAIQISPNHFFAHLELAVTYSLMSQEKEARAEAVEVLRINPKFSVDAWAKTREYKDQSQNDKMVNAMRKAGLK